MNFQDIAGLKFGRWAVLKRAHVVGKRETYWECLCACGTVRVVAGPSLKSGDSKSCGCIQNVHGDLRRRFPREYAIWKAMIARCHNRLTASYRYYGDRGITVCDDWRNSFGSFHGAMGTCPSGHVLDRINNNGHYEPSNCRWVLLSIQNRNRRSNIWIEHNGIRKVLNDWDGAFGISRRTIQRRLRDGWTMQGIESYYATHRRIA